MCARIYIIADQLWNRFNCDSRGYLVGPDFGCSAVTVRISPSFVGDFSFISYKLVLSAQFYFIPIQKRSEFVLTKRFINRNFIYHHPPLKLIENNIHAFVPAIRLYIYIFLIISISFETTNISLYGLRHSIGTKNFRLHGMFSINSFN